MGIVVDVVADSTALEEGIPTLECSFESNPCHKSISWIFKSKVKRFKSMLFKVAIPTLILTGVWIPLGHQPVMILAGAGMTIEHRISYGKWWDKDKRICHGKFGVLLLMVGCCITVVGIL